MKKSVIHSVWAGLLLEGGLRWVMLWLVWGCCALVSGGAEGMGDGSGVVREKLRVEGEGHALRRGKAGFTRMESGTTGVRFTNVVDAAAALGNRILENGSGVALGDVDGDGWCDIFLCSLEGENRLYLNEGGWRFREEGAVRGVVLRGKACMGTVLVDVDGDGDLDLLVSTLGSGVFLGRNDGLGHFVWDERSGLTREWGCSSMSLADVDGDGDLDLYVATYRTTNYKDRPAGVEPKASMEGGRVVVTPADRFVAVPVRNQEGVMLFERGEPDFLYLNDGQGHFEAVSWTDGRFLDERGEKLKEPPLDWGLSVMLRDLNGDGSPDIYVCNDFYYSRDQVWLNDGKGRFRDAGPGMFRSMSMSSMAVDVADLNRDGWDDVFVADMLSRDHGLRHRQRANVLKGQWEPPVWDPNYRPEVGRNTLFVARGDGSFAELAQFAGVEATEWTWGAIFLDVDLDGYEDLLIANGNEHDVLDADAMRRTAQEERATGKRRGLETFPRLATPKLVYRNKHDLTFEDRSEDWGFHDVGVAQGMALGDLDGDGDLDVVANHFREEARIYRNDSVAPRLRVRLEGKGKNRAGIGARIRLRGGLVDQSQNLVSGGRYLSGDDAVRVFAAAGGESGGMSLEVRWPAGGVTVVTGVWANHSYRVREAEVQKEEVVLGGAGKGKSLFERQDLVGGVRPGGRRQVSREWERQPLMPWAHSETGNGLSLVDVDLDGRLDVVVGGGRDQGLTGWKQTVDGGWAALEEAWGAWKPDAPGRWVTSVLPWFKPQSGQLLLSGVSHYEDGTTNGSMVMVGESRSGAMSAGLRARGSSVGPMALADVDADGDLDLFVGGRILPGRFPEAASSFFYRNEGGRFHFDPVNSLLVQKVGMVSGAVFTDLDGDGYPELALSCEWGSVRVLKNEQGRFRDVTESWGLGSLKGMWTSIAAGDWDGDGRMDLAVGNWGRNNKYQRHLDRPLRLYYWDRSEELAQGLVLECYWDGGVGDYVPWLPWDELVKHLPMVGERFHSYREYAAAPVAEILGGLASSARFVEVNTLDSVLLLNRGGKWEVKSLPGEAQWSPVWGMGVGDWDLDGRMDLVLAQNCFGVPLETSRHDGGQGLVLGGKGGGEFKVMTSVESGVRIPEEQRGVAVGDLNGDGRLDFVLGRLWEAPVVFWNRGEEAGWRVRLKGGVDNPNVYGAQLRWVGAPGKTAGAVWEVRAGNGMGGMDGVVTVVRNTGERGAKLQLRWPGGRMTEHQPPAGIGDWEIHAP